MNQEMELLNSELNLLFTELRDYLDFLHEETKGFKHKITYSRQVETTVTVRGRWGYSYEKKTKEDQKVTRQIADHQMNSIYGRLHKYEESKAKDATTALKLLTDILDEFNCQIMTTHINRTYLYADGNLYSDDAIKNLAKNSKRSSYQFKYGPKPTDLDPIPNKNCIPNALAPYVLEHSGKYQRNIYLALPREVKIENYWLQAIQVHIARRIGEMLSAEDILERARLIQVGNFLYDETDFAIPNRKISKTKKLSEVLPRRTFSSTKELRQDAYSRTTITTMQPQLFAGAEKELTRIAQFGSVAKKAKAAYVKALTCIDSLMQHGDQNTKDDVEIIRETLSRLLKLNANKDDTTHVQRANEIADCQRKLKKIHLNKCKINDDPKAAELWEKILGASLIVLAGVALACGITLTLAAFGAIALPAALALGGAVGQGILGGGCLAGGLVAGGFGVKLVMPKDTNANGSGKTLEEVLHDVADIPMAKTLSSS